MISEQTSGQNISYGKKVEQIKAFKNTVNQSSASTKPILCDIVPKSSTKVGIVKKMFGNIYLSNGTHERSTFLQ